MIGAIAGDVIGSAYEALGEKRYDFPLFTEFSRFTDDTVMTIAVANALLDGHDYAEAMRELGRKYPLVGYGAKFHEWVLSRDHWRYESYGNGGAMRVSAIGFAAASEDEVLREAQRSADPTHGHPEGIKGAQATALAIYLARTGATKDEIRRAISSRFEYDMDRTVESIRPDYSFDVAAARSVPEAIVCFLDATDFESTLRNVVSLGGDADTMGCIAGGIAQAFWGGVPEAIEREVRGRLPQEFLDVIARFETRYPLSIHASQ